MARVLLLDGYDESREAVATGLRAAGYDVIAFAEEDDAALALESTASREAVDVVLLDVPLAEAVEAAQVLRTKLAGRSATIVAVVDPSDTRHTREAAHTAGVDYFFLRPCPPAEVVKQLRRLLRT
jgi:DNA-binding response OmpR family regulator